MQASVQSAHTVQWSCTEVAVNLEKEYLAMAESGHAPSAVSSEKDVETRPVRACVLVVVRVSAHSHEHPTRSFSVSC